MKRSSNIIVENVGFLLFSAVSVALMFLLGKDIGPGTASSFIFLVYLIGTLIHIARRLKFVTQIFTPTFLAFLYLTLSYWGGSSVPVEYHIWIYQSELARITDFSMINGYLITCLALVAAISTLSLERSGKMLETFEREDASSANVSLLLIALAALIISSFFEHFLLFGLRYGLAVVVVSNVTRLKSTMIKSVCVLALLTVFLATSYQNKREIILVVLLVAFFFSATNRRRLNFGPKNIILATAGISILLVLIIAASIARGYGSYNVSGPLEALLHVRDYINSPLFFRFFLENVEVVFAYASTVLAIDMTDNGFISLQAGATFIKPIFLPIPREIFPGKPESAIAIFTQTLDPYYAADGNSLPVSVPAEVFMNFHFAGLIFLALIFVILDRLFQIALRSALSRMRFKTYFTVVLCTLSLLLVRGSGFDLYCLTSLLTVPSYLLISIFSTNKRRFDT